MKWVKVNWRLLLGAIAVLLVNAAAYGLLYWFVTLYYPSEAARWSQPIEEAP